MNEDNEAKVVMDGPCPTCGYIPLHQVGREIVCDGCDSRWPAENAPNKEED